MATALTPGRFYLIEAAGDLGAQTDWIVAGGDPDTIDLDQFTEGLTYVEITIPEGFTRRSNTGIVVTPSGAGKSYDERNAARFYSAMERGVLTTLAKANLVDKFIMSDRHTSGSDPPFTRYYLIVYFGVNAHLEFTDSTDTRRGYCRGAVPVATTQWSDSHSLKFLMRLTWLSIW